LIQSLFLQPVLVALCMTLVTKLAMSLPGVESGSKELLRKKLSAHESNPAESPKLEPPTSPKTPKLMSHKDLCLLEDGCMTPTASVLLGRAASFSKEMPALAVKFEEKVDIEVIVEDEVAGVSKTPSEALEMQVDDASKVKIVRNRERRFRLPTPPMTPGRQILAEWEATKQAKVCHDGTSSSSEALEMHVDVGKTGTDTPPMSPGAQILKSWEARVQAKVCHGRSSFFLEDHP